MAPSADYLVAPGDGDIVDLRSGTLSSTPMFPSTISGWLWTAEIGGTVHALWETPTDAIVHRSYDGQSMSVTTTVLTDQGDYRWHHLTEAFFR